MNKVAVEFVKYVLQQHPAANSFEEIYDAMTRTASNRSYYNLGYQELASTGISFSLAATTELERLIFEAQRLMILEG